MAEPKTVKLKAAVKDGDKTITEITLRPPVARDFRELPMDVSTYSLGHLLDLAIRLSGLGGYILDQLEPVDFMAVVNAVTDFLPDGRQIGGTPSPS